MDELQRATDRATDFIRDVVRLLSMVRLENFLRRIGVLPPKPQPSSTPNPGTTPAPVLRRDTWEEYIRRLGQP